MSHKAKQEAILHFIRTPLKHPMSKFLLQFLLEENGMLEKISFVRNREFLSHTMLVSELGSPRVGFELELGARQQEKVSVVNGQLIRECRRDTIVRSNEPLEAIQSLRNFQGRLYIVLSFSSTPPRWYEQVVEPNPAMPMVTNNIGYIDRICADIIREQIDMAILAVITRHAIDRDLACRDAVAFHEHAAVYRNIMQRCLWEFA